MSVLEIILFVIIGLFTLYLFYRIVVSNDIVQELENKLDKAIERLPKYVIENEIIKETYYYLCGDKMLPYHSAFSLKVLSTKTVPLEDYKYHNLQEVTYDNMAYDKKYLEVQTYRGLDCEVKYYYLGGVEQEPSEPLQYGETTISATEGE